MLSQDASEGGAVRQADADVAVQPPAANQRRVELLRVVARGDHDDALAVFHTVDLGQQGVDDLGLPIRVMVARFGNESTSSMNRMPGERLRASVSVLAMDFSRSP